MKYVVTVARVQTVEIETEAECEMDAMRYIEMNVQLGQFKNLDWKDRELYAKDAERCD